MRKWGKDRRACHIRRVNPKNTKHMCRNSGENRVFQESLEGNKWGGRCAGVLCGQTTGTCSRAGGAQRLRWKPGKGRAQAVHQEECGLGSPRRRVVERWQGLGSAQRAESRCKRPNGNQGRETGSELQWRTGGHAGDRQCLDSQPQSFFPACTIVPFMKRGNMGPGTPCKGGLRPMVTGNAVTPTDLSSSSEPSAHPSQCLTGV